jgi:hypothetical protein
MPGQYLKRGHNHCTLFTENPPINFIHPMAHKRPHDKLNQAAEPHVKSVLQASGYSLQDITHLRPYLPTKSKRPHNITALPMAPWTASPDY